MKYDSEQLLIATFIDVSELINILNKYDNNDIVKLVIYGMSDYPSTELKINNDIIIDDNMDYKFEYIIDDHIYQYNELDRNKIPGSIKVSKLIKILDKYEDTDKIYFVLFGNSKYPRLDFKVNNDIILTDDY